MNRFNNPLYWLHIWRNTDDDGGGGGSADDDAGDLDLDAVDDLLADINAIAGEGELSDDKPAADDEAAAADAAGAQDGAAAADEATAAADAGGAKDPGADAGDGADAAAADAAVKGDQKDFVPLATHLDERRQYQEKLDKLNQRLGRFEGLQERLDEFMQNKQATTAASLEEKSPAPDFLDSPKDYVDSKIKELDDKTAALDEKTTQTREQIEARERLTAISTELSRRDDAFFKTTPDYYAALLHVRDVNVANAVDMGNTPEKALEMAAQSMFIVQTQCLQKGIDPAAHMYNLAKRFGYAPAAKPAPAPAGDNKPAKSTDDIIDTLIAGQKAGSMGGEGTVADVSQMADDLSKDEFDEAMEEMFGNKQARR